MNPEKPSWGPGQVQGFVRLEHLRFHVPGNRPGTELAATHRSVPSCVTISEPRSIPLAAICWNCGQEKGPSFWLLWAANQGPPLISGWLCMNWTRGFTRQAFGVHRSSAWPTEPFPIDIRHVSSGLDATPESRLIPA